MNVALESWPKRHLINVDEYYKMAQIGLFASDARVELIEGEVIDTAPIGSRHAAMVDHLADLLRPLIGLQALVGTQRPLRLGERSEPQPDLMLLKYRPDRYRDAHPTAADVLLVVEVSDSTLAFDRGEKSALYARYGVREVWVVDLENGQLHCAREPNAGQYRSVTSLQAPQTVVLSTLSGVSLELARLFD